MNFMVQVKNVPKKLKKILIALIIIVVLVAGGCIYYINDYYHATERENALKDTDKVKVEKIDDGYFFNGYNQVTMLVLTNIVT